MLYESEYYGVQTLNTTRPKRSEKVSLAEVINNELYDHELDLLERATKSK